MSRFVRIGRSAVKVTASTSNISDALLNTAALVNSSDPVYGTGLDGDVTISTNTTLTSDKFYNNLTVNSGILLNPNGYRIFVRNILTLGSSATIGYTTGFATAGSIAQGGATGADVTHSLGGSSATQSATAPTAALGGSQYYQHPLQAVRGWAVSASSTTPTFLRGGAGGSSGPGGGVVILVARYISVSSGNATISVPGTAGSGGGGGGVIIIVSSTPSLPAAVATVVAGGTGCAAGTVNYMQVA